MTKRREKEPFSYVKHLREIRDRIGKEIEHMTLDEIDRWRQSQEHKDPMLRSLMADAKPPSPTRTKQPAGEMSDSTDDQPFSHVKHLREIRDRIGKKLEHMTDEEALRWQQSQEFKNPTLRRLMSSARPPSPKHTPREGEDVD